MRDDAQDLLAPALVVVPPVAVDPVVVSRPATLTTATADMRRAEAEEAELLAALERVREARGLAEAQRIEAEAAEKAWEATLQELRVTFTSEADALLQLPIGNARDLLTISDSLGGVYSRYRSAIDQSARGEAQRQLGAVEYERQRLGHDLTRFAAILAPAAVR